MSSGFGLAPMKKEGAPVLYDDTVNPYVHPMFIRDSRWALQQHAIKYFGWELMDGANIEELRKDPYWKYMED